MARRRFGARGELAETNVKHVLAMVNKGKRMSRSGVVLEGDEHDLTVISEHQRKQIEGEDYLMDWFNPETKRSEKRHVKRGQGRWGNTAGTRFLSVVDPDISIDAFRVCGNDACAKIIPPQDITWHDAIGEETLTFLGLTDVTETLTKEDGEEYEETYPACPHCGCGDLPTIREADTNYQDFAMNKYGRRFMTEKERAKWDKEWDKKRVK